MKAAFSLSLILLSITSSKLNINLGGERRVNIFLNNQHQLQQQKLVSLVIRLKLIATFAGAVRMDLPVPRWLVLQECQSIFKTTPFLVVHLQEEPFVISVHATPIMGNVLAMMYFADDCVIAEP